MARFDVVVSSYLNFFENLGVRAVATSDSNLPEILIIDPKYTLTAIIFLMEDELLDEFKRNEYVLLKKRALRDELQNIIEEDFKIATKVVRSKNQITEGIINIQPGFIEKIEISNLEQSISDAIFDKYNPNYSFARKRRIQVDDPFRENREIQRITLEGEQREYVDEVAHEVFWITGPAGSGKSLILVARAKKMAKENPDWNIFFVTYNRSLMRYFKDEFSEFDNVTVQTFGEFTDERDDKFRFYFRRGKEKRDVSIGQSNVEYLRAKEKGIERDVDALFIDEVQDFHSAWLKYCIETQVIGHGGATLAGDTSQAIYRENDIEAVLSSYQLKKVVLKTAYRNTKEILRAVEVLTGQPQNPNNAPDGVLPDLIYVDAQSSKNALNDAIIRDVVDFMKRKGVRERDIAILVTRNYYRYRLRQELQERLNEKFHYEVGIRSVEKGAADLLDIQEDTIKLTTVHNAKGLEFSAVFLVGIDDLDDEDDDEPMVRKGERIALVGPTRAKDRLFIYFSKDNIFTNRLRQSSEVINFRTYPHDYDKANN